ncbi:MAG: PaaX family transcriptional regulator C-terminal domain-containing protein [Acidimicrobiales bacterium]
MLASTLLGADPPDLPVAHLVHMAGLFGINANRARVALSRMATSGEVTTDGAGRYQLTGHLLERQHRQVASRAGTTREWPGTWHVVVVTTAGSGPDVRGERRRALTLARLAERREGVWLRPDNLDLHLGADITGDVAVFTGATTDRPEHTAAVLWDLDGWADRARDLLVRLDALAPSGPGDLAPGFVLSAAVVRHLQADPLLPAPLLPPLWPGADLRRVYDDWDRRYRRVLDRSGPSPG